MPIMLDKITGNRNFYRILKHSSILQIFEIILIYLTSLIFATHSGIWVSINFDLHTLSFRPFIKSYLRTE